MLEEKNTTTTSTKKAVEPRLLHTNEDDTLINVHIGNPLRRITALLEDIKKQKAFSFTLKGSLGLMGVVLTLSVFGLFGGNRILCNKGMQTQIGTIRALSAPPETSTVPFIGGLIDYVNDLFSDKREYAGRKRIILVKDDNTTIYLPYSWYVSYQDIINQRVYATGTYDICASTLKITDQNSLELYGY